MGGQRKTRKTPQRPLSSWLVLAAGIAAAGFGVSFACTGLPGAEDARTASSVAPPLVPAAGDPPSPTGAELPTNDSYADAIRRHKFELAAQLIDRCSEDEQKSPEVRYARALVALELGDVETALRKVNGLEDQWPHFDMEAKEIRLAAATASNDVTLLSHFLGKSTSLEERLLLAEAHEKSSSLLEARKIADEVLSELNRSKRRDKLALQARCRALKARTLAAEQKNLEAAKEYKWLATSAASLEGVSDWDARMVELDPKIKLTPQERLTRAKTFSDNGWVDRCENEVSVLSEAGAHAPSAAERDQLLAWAVYTSRTDYVRASQLFARAASHGGPDRQKNLYYEAKALARSHRDSDAIAKYEAVAKMAGEYTDHAAYQAARLRFIDGQWKAAVSGYENYLKRFGARARHKEGATYDLPIARLAAGDFTKAITELQKLLDVERDDRERARLIELQAVAYLGAGNKGAAIAGFRKVIDERPLSFPALMAAARLKEMGEPVPPTIQPAPSATKGVAPLKLSLPDKVWRLSRVGLDSQAEQVMRLSERDIKLKYGARSGEALCRLYGQLQSAQRRYQVAQTAASWSSLKEAPGHETAWEWDCIYPSPYEEVAAHEGALRHVPTAFIYGVMRQESAFRPTVVSPAAAVGLMQIIPPTASRIAEEIDATYDPDLMRAPAVNIRFGTYYLRRLLDIFANRPELAAAAYNAGPQAVGRWLRAGESLPLDLFVARIPYSETRNYVYRVMGNFARYSYLNENGPLSDALARSVSLSGAVPSGAVPDGAPPISVEFPVIDLKLPQGLKVPDDAY